MVLYQHTMPQRSVISYMGKRRVMKRAPLSRGQVRAVKKIVQKSGELKYKDDLSNTNSSFRDASQTSHNLSAFQIAQGDGLNNRDGDQIDLKSYKIKVILKTGSASGQVRAYLYQWRGNVEPTGLTNIEPHGFFPRLDVADQPYKILYDRVFKLDPASYDTHQLNISVPMNKLLTRKIKFDAGATGILDGDIKFQLTTDNATASQMTTDLNARVVYHDN